MHDRTLSEALKELEATRDGLSESEAVRRLEVHGPNLLRSAPPVSPWTVLLRQFRNVLILLLLAGAVLSIFLGQGVEAVAIIVIVVLAVVLGFVQEFRAERAIDALREMAAPLATVWREGKERSIPSKDVVPGDVILLHTGDRIPADGRLLESQNLRTAEAALTGESEAIEKSATSESAADAPLAERANTVHAGTIVTYGRARALVVATGMSTEFGRIAEMLELVDTSPSPLQRDLDRLGHTLAKAALAVVLVIVVLGVIRGQPFVEMLIFGIALAVAAVPEALPAVVTISLALGVQRLVKRGALMRRLPAVETLGSTSVICTDKTGTLTRDEMTVRRMWCGGDEYAITGAGYEPEGRFELRAGVAEDSKGLEPILRAGQLASDASVDRDEAGNWVAKGDPTEAALVVLGMKAGLMPAAVAAAAPRIDEIPFDAATRR
ncbi:MAG: HAD-IC family P-type ATPase, partial [Planctomycetes bacterium]|nr:HAD-IC family P-type ATPase [Planctomycetota bacterium]